MIGNIVAALERGDTYTLREWLSESDVDVEAVRSLPLWHSASSSAVLPTALAAAARRPYGISLLLIYLLVVCESTWEESYHYAPIWAALRDGCRWREHVEVLDPAEALAAEAAATLLQLTDAEIQVENALTSGQIRGFGDAAWNLTAMAERAGTVASRVPADCASIGQFVATRAAAAQRYYRAAAVAGHALHRFLSEPGTDLSEAVAQLASAEAAGDIEQNRLSELRAHRFTMQALQDTASRPWLRINSGKIIYIYPFAMPGSAEALADRAADPAVQWRLAGSTPRAVHPSVALNDIWDGTDLFGRTYGGTQVVLPGVTIRDLGESPDAENHAELSAEVRVSRIGNHYVRLEMPLADAGPQDLYSAMFRAAPEHGSMSIAIGDGGERWPRLSDLAQRIATDVALSLGVDTPWSRGSESPAAGREESLARRGPYHVLVVVDAASVSDGPVGPHREVRTRADLLSAVGVEVLSNPVTHCVSALAEWSRYPLGAGLSVAETATHRDDVVLRTANTTVMVALGSPEFHTRTREALAEFVGSLDGLFAGWSADLTVYYHAVERLLASTDPDNPRPASPDLAQAATQLRALQQRLVEFIAEVRSTVALIESPGLVASPVVSAMKSALLESAGFRARARELDRQVEQVLGNRLDARIEESVRSLAQRLAHEEELLERRQRARLDTALAVIAAVGISGLGQIIQAGYDVRTLGALWISVAIVVVAVLFGIGVRLVSRGDQRRLSHRAGSTHPAQSAQAPQTRGEVLGTLKVAPSQRPSADATTTSSHGTARSAHANSRAE